MKAGALAVALVALAAAGSASSARLDRFVGRVVASDRADPQLVNAWGLAASPSGPWWVANEARASSTLYDGNGRKQALNVRVIGGPTGVVYYGGHGFLVREGGAAGSARFLYACEDGTIRAWSPVVPDSWSTEAVVAVDDGPTGALFRGLTLAHERLYVADFHNARVLVYDSRWRPITACMRATGGVPFLMRELVDALAEGRIAPTAEAARHVERIGGRSVGRSIRLRLRRLPEPAGRFARALAVLEQSGLHEASQLAGLADAEGADAAELLAAAGILEPGRPLTFSHPIVRSGIYTDLTSSERAHDHARAARILAEQPGNTERVAQHLLSGEPAGDAWVVDRLREVAHAAVCHGAPESASAFLRRALAEPPTQADRSLLLLELGVAEASAGLDGWPEHLQGAVDAAPNPEAAARAARVLARALNRAQRYEEAVEVLDRAAAELDGRDPALALELEAGAVIAGLNDPSTAPAMGSRRAALREPARDPEAPAELLGVASFISVLGNEPVEVG